MVAMDERKSWAHRQSLRKFYHTKHFLLAILRLVCGLQFAARQRSFKRVCVYGRFAKLRRLRVPIR